MDPEALVAQLPVVESRIAAIPPLMVIGFPCKYPGLPLLALFAEPILTVTVTVYCVLSEADGLVDTVTVGLCNVYPPFADPNTALIVNPVSMFWQFEPETLEELMV